MTVRALPPLRWSTASISGTKGPAGDLSMLGAHYAYCKGDRGRWFSVHCAIESLDAFVASRLVTTLCVIGAFVGVGALVL